MSTKRRSASVSADAGSNANGNVDDADEAESDPERISPLKKRKHVSPKDDEYVEEDEPEEEEEEEEADEEEEEAMEEKQAASSRVDSEAARRSRSEYAESGIIDRIEVKNFLCHKHLKIDMHPNVNFINGENGSGKSAILVALQTCLGSRASDTNRASSMKQLILEGQQKAELTVVIKNAGKDAFTPATYGKEIRVIRTISSTGSNTFRIDTADSPKEKGQHVSRSRDELNTILDHFNIQIGNPCVLMNQDTSREFLQAKNQEKALYKFFLKATLLDKMKEHNAEHEVRLQETHANIASQKASMEHEKAQVEDARAKKEEAEAALKLQEKISMTTNELLWSIVKKKMEEKAEQEADIEKDELIRQSFVERIASAEDDAKADEERQRHQNAIADATREVNAAKDAIESVRPKRQALKLSLKKADQERKQQLGIIAQQNKIRKSAEQAIAEIHLKGAADMTEEQQQHTQKVERLTRQIEQIKSAGLANVEKSKSLKVELDAAKEAVERGQADLETKRQDIADLEERIRRVKSANQKGGDPLALFERQHSTLRDKIKRAKWTSSPPRGPLGAYMSIKDPKWAVHVEAIVRLATLSSYVVDNFKDRETLVNLARSIKWQHGTPPIIVQKFVDAPYKWDPLGFDTQDMKTVADHLIFQDNWVQRAITDQVQPECQLLNHDTRQAMQLLEKYGKQKYPGKAKLLSVLSYSGTKQEGTRGAISSGVACKPEKQKYAKLLKPEKTTIDTSDDESLVISKKEELKALERSHRQNEQVLRKLQEDNRALSAAGKKGYTKLKDLTAKLQQLQDSAPVAEEEESTEEYELQISEANEAISAAEQALESVESRKADMENQLSEFEEEFKRLERENTKAQKRAQDLDREYSKFQEDREKDKLTLTKLRQGLSNVERKLSTKKGLFEALVKQIEQHVADAADASEKASLEEFEAYLIAQGYKKGVRSPSRVRDQVTSLKDALEREQKRMDGTVEEITSRFYKLERKYNMQVMNVQRLQANAADLGSMIKKRQRELENFRTCTARAASEFFRYYLQQQKGFTGTVDVQHDKQELKLNVTPASNGKTSESTSNTKSLSGGERAFATLAFVLALGESMDAPFRAMDEFDIFMDSVNRATSIKILVEVAHKCLNRQFIFITPHDVSMLRESKHTRLHKLRPPDRRQRVLQFGAAEQ